MNIGRFFNNRGGSSLRTFVWILVLAALGYGAYKFVPPYVSYYMLKTDVENEADVAHMFTDDTIASHILKKSVSWSVPIGVEDINIDRTGTYIHIWIEYIETVDMAGGYSKDLPFRIDVEKPLKERNGALR